MTYLTQFLQSGHNRNDFHCGKEMLDNYFRQQAGQDVKRKLAACFVWTDPANNRIKGFYTLSGNSVPMVHLPEKIRKKLPFTYLSVPVTLLGRLAVDLEYQGKGTGRLLLLDAMKRSFDLSKSIGSFALAVDPLDADAGDFYEKYGFIRLSDSKKMFLPMKTIEKLFTDQ